MSCTVLLQCCLITPRGWDLNSGFIVVDVNKDGHGIFAPPITVAVWSRCLKKFNVVDVNKGIH